MGFIKDMALDYATLSYLGVVIEDIKEPDTFLGKADIYFSIPEVNRIEFEKEQDIPTDILADIDCVKLSYVMNSKEGLIIAAKEGIKRIIMNAFREFGEDVGDIQEIEDSFSNYVRFHMKERKGVVWTTEKAKKNLEKANHTLKVLVTLLRDKESEYTEV